MLTTPLNALACLPKTFEDFSRRVKDPRRSLLTARRLDSSEFATADSPRFLAECGDGSKESFPPKGDVHGPT